jgi:hypothetical protein
MSAGQDGVLLAKVIELSPYLSRTNASAWWGFSVSSRGSLDAIVPEHHSLGKDRPNNALVQRRFAPTLLGRFDRSPPSSSRVESMLQWEARGLTRLAMMCIGAGAGPGNIFQALELSVVVGSWRKEVRSELF